MKYLQLLFVSLLLLIVISACEEEDTSACVNIATVDRESVPDCGIVLILEKGGRIIPITGYGCGVGLDLSDTVGPYDLIQHGDKVRFGYSIVEEIEGCEEIPYAYVSCLEVIESFESDQPTR